jgi:DNA polymerase
VSEPPSADILREARGRLEYERALGGRYRYVDERSEWARAIVPSEVATPGSDAARGVTVAPQEADTGTISARAGEAVSPYERIAELVPADSPLRSLNTLEEIAEWLERTVLVPIDAARTRAVLGDGSGTSGLMVIGEAPGADEDRQGLPFVGRAGQLLTQILAAVDFNRPDVYITNVVKSRPPNNRDPEPAEVAAHLPILHRQIALVRPRLILVLGRVAATTLLGRQASLASLRGVFHDYHGIPLVVTYHPAALLRDPKWKRPTWDDVRMLRARYDELMRTGAPNQ